jgi:mercuric ion binding protein
MKTIKLFSLILLLSALGANLSAQTAKKSSDQQVTETFKVSGNCDMCKSRIEKAVKEADATSADWNQKTKMLTLTFNPSKSTVDGFAKILAGVGHDTENYRAEDKVYDALPDCCKYERANAAVVSDYTCPMHSDIHSDKPGKCPKCGMALVKKESTKSKSGKSMQGMEGMREN